MPQMNSRDEELAALTLAWHNQMETKNMTLGERERILGVLVNMHLMLVAGTCDESLNIVSNRFFAKVLAVNENAGLRFVQSHNLSIKP